MKSDKFHTKFYIQCRNSYELGRYMLTVKQAETLEEKHKNDENYDFWIDPEAYEKGKDEVDGWASYAYMF